MRDRFEMAAGCVPGLEHTRIGMNCHDSYAVVRTADYLCGIVSDGCSGIPEGMGNGHPRSEVGSGMISRLAAKVIPSCLIQCVSQDKAAIDDALETARLKLLESMWGYVSSLTDERADAMAEEVGGLAWPVSGWQSLIGMYFAATVVGFFVSDSVFVVFSIGDGFYSVNGNLRQLDTADEANNAPAYLSYGLIGELPGIPAEALHFKANWIGTPDFQRAMIATDGIRFMIGKDEENVPGKTMKIGSVAQLWDDKMFVNKDMLRRRLALLNKDVSMPDWTAQTMTTHAAILKDDAAVVSIRRLIASTTYG